MAIERLVSRNVEQLLEEVREVVPLTEDSVTLAVVDHPATTQRLLAVRRLDVPASTTMDQLDLSELLREEMCSLPVPPWQRVIETTVTTIIARRGFNLWSEVESTWAMAWRYSNHLTGAMDLDTIVVTEHGWASMLCEVGGLEPRFDAAS